MGCSCGCHSQRVPGIMNRGRFLLDLANLDIRGRNGNPVKLERQLEGTKVVYVAYLDGELGSGEAGAKGDKGEPGEDGTDGASAYEIWKQEGNTGTREQFLTSLKGPKGDKGDKGDVGDTGAKGDKGDTGLKGDTGVKGDKGDNGTQGDKGDKGDKGDTGSKGDTGATGAPGPNWITSWVSLGNGLEYRVHGGDVVHIRGKIPKASITSSGVQIATIPQAYRPSIPISCDVAFSIIDGVDAAIRIFAGGGIHVYTNNTDALPVELWVNGIVYAGQLILS